MAEPVEVFRYIRYLRLRWRVPTLSCVLALALAAGATLLLPRQYTATARVLIEPPAGADLRSAMAVSPIYLESLKTYEHFASSDSLFQQALQRFGLPLTGPIESLKKRVLRVGLVRNTRILEISATLPDPRAAQAMAQYVAASTVDLTRAVGNDADRDLTGGVEQQLQVARARVEQSEQAWAKLLGEQPVDELNAAMESDAELRASIQKEIASEELQAADSAEREKQASGTDFTAIRRDLASARARIAEMHKQVTAIDRLQATREATLARRVANRDRIEADRKARQTELAAAEARLRDVRGDAGYRGERMRIIDPGIVPQRPSSPDLTLNLLAALLLGLVLPVLYLAVEMNYQEQRIAARRNYPAYLNASNE